jgi:hypothetical protein
MLDFFLTYPYSKTMFFATNLQYDFLSIIDNDFNLLAKIQNRKKIKITYRNNKIIFIKIRTTTDRTIYLIDTLNYIPFSVEKLGNIFNIEKLSFDKLGEKDLSQQEQKELLQYNIRDAYISAYTGQFIQQSLNQLGGNMRPTISSSSLYLFKQKYLKEPIHQQPPEIIKTSFKAYYGARCEVFKRGKIENLYYYDFNSMYPYCLKSNPYPNPNTVKMDRGNKNIIRDYEGISEVTMKCSYSYIPYLQHRDKKLIFPTGKLKGWYTNFEIREALKLGYKLLYIGKQIYYTKSEYYFSEFIDSLYNLRLKFQKENNPMEMMCKLLLNSFYGKWAFNPKDKNELITMEQIDKYRKNGYDCTATNEDINLFNAVKKKQLKYPAYCIPIWSIYTTAYGRFMLFQELDKLQDHTNYCDTDSVISSKKLHTSDKLGKFKLLSKIKYGVLIRPKLYFIDDMIKGKGLKLKTIEDFQNIMDGKLHNLKRVTGLMEGLKRINGFSPNQWVNITKKIDLEDDKRRWLKKFNPRELEDSLPIAV